MSAMSALPILESDEGIDLDRQVIGKQSVVFLFDHRVTLASALLQPDAIEHSDMATGIADQAGLLKFQCRLSNAFAANAEHIGDQFLSHQEFIPFQSVQAQQLPTAQLLIE